MALAIDNYFQHAENHPSPGGVPDNLQTHWVAYHLLWCPKRVKPVLIDEVAEECEGLIRAACEQHGWEVLQLSLFPACVHLFVRASPSDAAQQVVKQIKDYTASRLRRRYPALRRLPSLWTRSYLCTTASQISDELLLQYIYAQKRS